MTDIPAIDQGKGVFRAIPVAETMRLGVSVPAEFTRHGRNSGRVEHDPRDIRETARRRGGAVLRVDGGRMLNGKAMPVRSDIPAAPLDGPGATGATVHGAAWLAGMTASVHPDQQRRSPPEKRFEPAIGERIRAARGGAWPRAGAAVPAG